MGTKQEGRAESPKNWWSQAGSNRRPLACHASALPAELWPRLLPDGVGIDLVSLFIRRHGRATRIHQRPGTVRGDAGTVKNAAAVRRPRKSRNTIAICRILLVRSLLILERHDSRPLAQDGNEPRAMCAAPVVRVLGSVRMDRRLRA